MEKGWKQTWKNLLFQHFEIYNIDNLTSYLPKDCKFDSFDGKYYIGLVSMTMNDVKHKSTGDFIWFKKYNELNVRTYVVHKGKPGVLFLSLDVDSLISIFGARVFYGLPYRKSKYKNIQNIISSFRNSKLQFKTQYKITSEEKIPKADSFASWCTNRYFFVNKYLGINFKGEINHEPWTLSLADVKNENLTVLDKYKVKVQYPQTYFCKEIQVTTNKLYII